MKLTFGEPHAVVLDAYSIRCALHMLGAMFLELAQNLRSLEAGTERHKMRIYVGHDGSMIRLASGLGIKGPLKWPALGSEISMEVCPSDINLYHFSLMSR